MEDHWNALIDLWTEEEAVAISFYRFTYGGGRRVCKDRLFGLCALTQGDEAKLGAAAKP